MSVTSAKDERELLKFTTSPAHREKVISSIHREQDLLYHQNIRRVESELNRLTKQRANQIMCITNARWESILNGKLAINRTEGTIQINQAEVLFSSIQGAELNVQQGIRVVTTDNSRTKKHASVGGAVVGGVLFGPVGAVAGGVGLGKTKTTGKSVSNQTPTCTHMGVLVNIDGFVSEIVLLNNQVDQSSDIFQKTYQLGQQIVSQLGVLAKTAVPMEHIPPEHEPSVKLIDAQISLKQDEFKKSEAQKPTYELPNIYRTAEQQYMSDEEYLVFLSHNDTIRQEQMEHDKELLKQQKHLLKKLEKEERAERRASGPKIGEAKAISIIADILFWICSVFVLTFAIAAFSISENLISGLILLFTAVLVNPTIYRIIQKQLFLMKRWMCVIILLVGFLAGMFLLGTS